MTEPTLPFSATIPEATRLTGLSKTALYQLLNDGTIEARKRGTTTYVLMEGVRRYMESLPKATFGVGRRAATVRQSGSGPNPP